MKIILINPTIRTWAKPNVFPTGLGLIASILKKKHEVEIWDINAKRWDKKMVEEKIKNTRADIFGISGIITIFKYVKFLAKLLKKYHPSIPIICGGTLATSIPRILLENTDVNIAVTGEGELTIEDLLDNLNQKSKVKGIWYKEGNKIKSNPPRELIKDLDTLPFPAYDLWEKDGSLAVYLHNPIGFLNKRKWLDGEPVFNVKSINIVTARGCPFSCRFCYSKYLGKKFRRRSNENIVKEMRFLVEKYNCGYLHFTDELSFSKQNGYDMCNEIERQNLKISWGAPCRIDLMDGPLLEKLSKSGCKHLGVGIESFSPIVLEEMNKKMNPIKVKEKLALAKEIIPDIDTSFILGYPSETKQTIQETIEVCREINLMPNAIFFATPYPGTTLYQIALQNGLIKDEVKYIESLGEQGNQILINFTEMSNDELWDWKKKWMKAI